jgi:hypothetical protein
MNTVSKQFIRRLAAPVVLAMATAVGAAAQSTPKAEPKSFPEPPATYTPPRGPRPVAPAPENPYDTSEKSIRVDSKINVMLPCVTEGSVTINGWKRNEVRVLVREGSDFDFRVMEKSPDSAAPVWIKIIGVDAKRRYGPANDCVTGGEISIDVPLNATVTLKGRDMTTTVDTVRTVKIESAGGDISIRNVTNGISADTHQGDITVEASKGAMTLETTTGNILVFEGGPSEIGDVFTAKTSNGAVALQHLGFRQVNVNSITGSVAYTGEIKSGAAYNLRTSKGSIKLTIPQTSSFQFWATYGYGEFASELPIDLTTERVAPGSVKTVNGKMGKGDGMIKLATTNGSIGFRKL